jgi:hypothetical protein
MSSAEGKKTGVLRGILVVIGSVVLGSVVMFAVQSANYVVLPGWYRARRRGTIRTDAHRKLLLFGLDVRHQRPAGRS